MAGICKSLLALDDAARDIQEPALIDHEFIDLDTHGFNDYANWLRQLDWAQIEARAGLSRAAMEETARFYAGAKAVIAVYGMGLTQHRAGVENVQMLSNLLLMRGNIGRPGAGICPVRGHSNVQGQRTVGMTEKSELAPLDLLERQFHFEAPRWTGLSTIDACKGMIEGSVHAFVGLGGNFLRAVPDRQVMEDAWRRLRLSVQVVTKLNRSQVVHGEVAFVLPCLGRIEIDMQATGPQTVTMEDSTGCFHASHGQVRPASPDLLSEHAIVAGLARATLEGRGNVPWGQWVDDYHLVRDAIATSYPSIFADFNQRIADDHTFARPNTARQRVWKTKTGKANFIVPKSLDEDRDMPAEGVDVLSLITLRSNGQFNTTVYSDNDRFRGIFGARNVLLMNPRDMEDRHLAENDLVRVETIASDEQARRLDHLRIVAYDIPLGCCASYYPECNVLIPLWHHAERSKVPAAKSIPVRLRLMADIADPGARARQRVPAATHPGRN